MPILQSKGAVSAQGYGQTTPRPLTFTGTPAENNRAHGVIRMTGNASITLNFPNLTLTTAGYAMWVYKLATITGGVSTSITGGGGYNIVTSLVGVGSYINGVGTTTVNANSLTANTNTSITLGTFFSGTTVGTDTVLIYFLFQNSQAFSCVQYTGNNTARTISFVAASNSLNPRLVFVANTTAGTLVMGQPNSSTSNAWGFFSGGQTPTAIAGRWQAQFGGGLLYLGAAGSAGSQNITGNIYNAFCWDGNSSSTVFGSNNQQILAGGSQTTSWPTLGNKNNRDAVTVGNQAQMTQAIWLVVNSNTATACSWTNGHTTSFTGGMVPGSITYGFMVPASGTIPTIQFSNFGTAGAGGIAGRNDSSSTGSHAWFVWFFEPSDFNIDIPNARPFYAGAKSALIASGVTTSTYNIGNTNNYPFYYTFVLVVSGVGTNAVAARLYTRNQQFIRCSDANLPSPYYGMNATAGGTQASSGYDGRNFEFAGLVSTQSHAILYGVQFPRIHCTPMWSGTGTVRTFYHQLGDIPTYMWVRNTDISNTSTILFHNALGVDKYIDISGANAAVTDTTVWNNTALTATTITCGTSALVNTSNAGYHAFAWCSRAGFVNVGYYPGASASQEILIGFQPSTVIITDGSGTDGTVMFTASMGMTGGSNYRMRLSGAANNATLGDVCLGTTLGFTMASTTILNTAGRNYYFIAFL